ncbi:PREDICTED: carboxypeptidase B-like [Wasmannia auropunctata]|uniref:carboxypeptidase B-like n=1 Tax=Wasmannia auropunctata TaxID=64793 RepID=UPI0005EF95B3|nr:PREDICTED: carboxypeptidase B-like [Wasmannia auropunctata]XP_011693533.1 PREDICTED: carboxypeptidase B-like [Wasmannia auropunctata]XP_011693534.1 PREDICTED: carboxypeptidase B-like [Wasmannia auropunctata]
MRNSGQLRTVNMKWVTLTTLAIVVFVDATRFVDPVSKEPVPDYFGDGIEQIHKRNTALKAVYEGDQVWRLYKHNDTIVNNYVDEYESYGSFSIWSNQPSSVDIFVKSQMLDTVETHLRQSGIKYDVLIEDVQRAIEEENVPLSVQMAADLEGRKGHRMEWSSYHGLDDINNYLDYLVTTYPDVCSVQTIGQSVEGRPLKLLRISNGYKNAPAIWIDGGIHAREWISPASVTYIIDYLVENSENLKLDFYILPVVNPDGYQYSIDHDRLWRKNRRKAGRCVGTDLNRNFGYRWGGKGTSKNMCHETYPGSKAFSEPETSAISNFFLASSANFKAYISFHSYGQYILYPWGYDQRLPPDYLDLDNVGREAAEAMKQTTNDKTVYTVGNSAITLYPAAGGSDDWAKAVLKIKYAYTVELRDTGRYGFMLPSRYITSTAKEALAFVNTLTKTILNEG